MLFHDWLLLLGACLAISISPGPGALFSMRQGIRHSIPIATYGILGLQIGILIQIAIIFFGLGVLIVSSTILYTIVTIIGALYLFGIGMFQILNAQKHSFIQTELKEHKKQKILQIIISGIILDSTNIKGTVLFLALFSQFISTNTTYNEFGIIALTIVVVDTIIMFCYVVFATKLKVLLSSPKYMKLFNIISGSLFILLAILLLIK